MCGISLRPFRTGEIANGRGQAYIQTVRPLNLSLLEGRLAICRLDANQPIPAWAGAGGFCSITRTAVELSIVCDEDRVPAEVRQEAGWRAFRVEGPLPFDATGILAAIAAPLAAAGVPIFAVSTFDTDYVLVKDADARRGAEALAAAGHRVGSATSPPPEPRTTP